MHHFTVAEKITFAEMKYKELSSVFGFELPAKGPALNDAAELLTLIDIEKFLNTKFTNHKEAFSTVVSSIAETTNTVVLPAANNG